MTDIINEEENTNNLPEEEQESVVVDNGQTYVSEETAIVATDAANRAKLWAEESERQANLSSGSAVAAAEARDDAVEAKEYAEAAITDTNLITVATDLQSTPSNIKTVATNISNVNTVAGVSSAVTTVSAISGNVTTVAGNSANVTTVATSISNVNKVGNDISNVNDVADDLNNIDNVAGDLTNINTVAGVSSEVSTVAGISSNVTTVAGISSNVSAVAGNASNINAVAGNATNINAVNANKTNIDNVAGNKTNIDTVAGISSDVSDVADMASDIAVVVSLKDDIPVVVQAAADIDKVEDIAEDITTVSGISSNVTTVAGISSDVTAVAGNNANITAVAGNATNINAVNANKTNIDAVAGNATNINAVNANKTNIDAVAGDLTNINTVAADLTNIDNASTYANNANIWAEGTDVQVQALGGIHSSKGWADQSAQGQVQSDWTEADTTAKSYIRNKPSTMPSVWGQISGNPSNQTDLQNALNGKQNNLIAGTDIKITGIPSSYVALSFIETSGTQYINTLISVNDNNKFEIVFANDSNNPNSDRRIISQGNNSLRITANTISWFSKNYHFVGNISADIYNTVICGFNLLEINGSNIQGISDSDSASGTYVYLFSTNSGTSNSIIKLKSLKVWNSAETLVGYFIPVKRLSDNEIGLYDVVSESFFTNSGTGDFVGGESLSTSSIIEFTNDSGFITGITSSDVTTALGYTPLSNSTKYGADLSYSSNSLQLLDQDGNSLGNSVTIQSSPDRNIGEIIQSTIPLTDAELHLLDGALINGSGSYSAFVTHIAGLVSGHSELFTTEANWQQSVTDYGVCGKFVYDSVNNTVRLPKITGFTEGAIDPAVLGDLTEAGLPDLPIVTILNHTGYPNGSYDTGNGQSNEGYWRGWEQGTSIVKSDTIYGNSTTVQPQSIKVLYYIVIATSTKTQIEVDIDEIATDLNGKADVDLSNCTKPHIVETYVNGTSWYRVYSDGWCEQGGVRGSGQNVFTSFLKSYNSTNYTLVAEPLGQSGQTRQLSPMLYGKAANGFYSFYGDAYYSINWIATGYIS